MPALRKTTVHESTVTYATGLVQHVSKTVYEIDVLDMGATETFHGLGSRDRHGDQVATLLVTLTDQDAPFVTACGAADHQRTHYYCGMPGWAATAIRGTVPHALPTAERAA